MSKLPLTIRKRLQEEAREWDASVRAESPNEVQKLVEKAELFESSRPGRQPVSLRMDPFDTPMLKRIGRKKGIPCTQLMAIWLHERIEQEKKLSSGGKVILPGVLLDEQAEADVVAIQGISTTALPDCGDMIPEAGGKKLHHALHSHDTTSGGLWDIQTFPTERNFQKNLNNKVTWLKSDPSCRVQKMFEDVVSDEV